MKIKNPTFLGNLKGKLAELSPDNSPDAGITDVYPSKGGVNTHFNGKPARDLLLSKLSIISSSTGADEVPAVKDPRAANTWGMRLPAGFAEKIEGLENPQNWKAELAQPVQAPQPAAFRTTTPQNIGGSQFGLFGKTPQPAAPQASFAKHFGQADQSKPETDTAIKADQNNDEVVPNN